MHYVRKKFGPAKSLAKAAKVATVIEQPIFQTLERHARPDYIAGL